MRSLLKEVAVIIQPISVILLMDSLKRCSTLSISYACLLTFTVARSTI